MEFCRSATHPHPQNLLCVNRPTKGIDCACSTKFENHHPSPILQNRLKCVYVRSLPECPAAESQWLLALDLAISPRSHPSSSKVPRDRESSRNAVHLLPPRRPSHLHPILPRPAHTSVNVMISVQVTRLEKCVHFVVILHVIVHVIVLQF